MRTTVKRLAVGAVLVVLAHTLAGCFLLPDKKYDGSESFYDQHPEYKNAPAYMNPSDDGGNDLDHPGRPW